MTYLVSVIIPLYNEEMHIKQNLNSLINQTIKFENIEVLLIDHCSTDNTLNIIKQLENKSENIKVVHLKENTGTPGNPRNAGINKASSDYIMFLDADDYYLNDICETLYRKIKKEDVDFVSCLYCFNTKTNINTAQTSINYLKKYGSEIKINSIDELPEIYEVYNPHCIMVWNKIYKKSFILKNNIKFPKKCLAEDLYFNIQCFLNGKFILLNEYIGYFYIIDELSVCHAPTEKSLNKFLCGYKMIFDYLNCEKYEIPKIISDTMISWTLLFLNNKLSYKKQKELLKSSQPFYKNYNLNNKILHNTSFLSLIENIFIQYLCKYYHY